MLLRESYSKLGRYYSRNAASICFRKPLDIRPDRPTISFTFDDFPRSALLMGGSILERFGLAGTYFVSLSLLGKASPSGEIAGVSDLRVALEHGHELGCHTFDHCHSWQTASGAFENSVVANRARLNGLFPGARFMTFSYPISPPRPMTKARIRRHFLCCRGGGQTFNAGRADLNQLAAYFLEKSRDNADAVKDVIDRNRRGNGWLIFATHDVSENPSPFGCTPAFFEEIVGYAVSSGASILPVVRALDALGAIPERLSEPGVKPLVSR